MHQTFLLPSKEHIQITVSQDNLDALSSLTPNNHFYIFSTSNIYSALIKRTETRNYFNLEIKIALKNINVAF